jgi:hypothetical protein
MAATAAVASDVHLPGMGEIRTDSLLDNQSLFMFLSPFWKKHFEYHRLKRVFRATLSIDVVGRFVFWHNDSRLNAPGTRPMRRELFFKHRTNVVSNSVPQSEKSRTRYPYRSLYERESNKSTQDCSRDSVPCTNPSDLSPYFADKNIAKKGEIKRPHPFTTFSTRSR